MLPKKSRLKRADFSEILTSRRFYNSKHFILRVGSAKNQTKVAVSVSKKISKSAVVRNTTRRRAYSALYPLINDLSSGAYLFAAKAGAQNLKGNILAEELSSLLKELKRS